MANVLEELGVLDRSRPGLGASAAEVAVWQERRALMLEHAAALRELDADLAVAWAMAAHARAASLLGFAQGGALGAEGGLSEKHRRQVRRRRAAPVRPEPGGEGAA